MVGKNIMAPETLTGALQTLSEEIQPNSLVSVSVEYRKNLALNLFYKVSKVVLTLIYWINWHISS